MNELLVFVLGLGMGLVLGSVVYELFTYPLIKKIVIRRRKNNDKF